MEAEKKKMIKYANDFQNQLNSLDQEFVVFAAETLGGYSVQAVKLMKLLAAAHSYQNNFNQKDSLILIRNAITTRVIKSVAHQLLELVHSRKIRD